MELARHTGLSAALLSKLDRSKLYPTLPTLARIATVFDVGLDHFFTDERNRHVVALAKKQDRQRFPERPGLARSTGSWQATRLRLSRRLGEHRAAHRMVNKSAILTN